MHSWGLIRMHFLSRILWNNFHVDNNSMSISQDRTTQESCCLGFMAVNSLWADTDLNAHDSLDGPV
jgi:hypothetical protein